VNPDRHSSPEWIQATNRAADGNTQPAVIGQTGTFPAADGVEFAGRSVLNVVWHLHALGFAPLLITRVGDDVEGRQVMLQLEKSGLNTAGVQIDDSLPTYGSPPDGDYRSEVSCAWEALDWKTVVDVIDCVEPVLLFHGVAAAKAASIQGALNSIQNRSAVPFFADLDLTHRALPIETVRRALLGVKWIRTDAKHLPELIGEPRESISRSILGEAIAVQARFALESIVVEHRGIPILGVCADRVARGTVSPPADPTFLPGGRDAATAALIVGLILDWREHLMIERAAQFAFLAGAEKIASRVDRMVYTHVLEHWGLARAGAVIS
jgi:hypothetical protein